MDGMDCMDGVDVCESVCDGFVLSLCDRSGVMVAPWAAAGFRCLCVDIESTGENAFDGVEYVRADVRRWLPPWERIRICFAFPPCTDLATSGRRWFREKGLSALGAALDVVDACRRICEWQGGPWMLENPVSTLATYWRKPDYYFEPCYFGGYEGGGGDTYTKKTSLWVGNGFIMPEPLWVEPVEGSRMHKMPESSRRSGERSLTPRGFARAVFEANRSVV